MVAAINEISIRTSIAAVNKGDSLRVYETAVDGGIRETQYEGKWTGGTYANVIATGKIGTAIAATSLGLDHIRVYYVGHDNKGKEACYDSGSSWYNGAFSEAGFEVAPYSSFAAIFLGNQSTLRVYGQLPNDTIQEWGWDGRHWEVLTNLGAALPGTSIAATTWGGAPYHIRVYLQDSNLNIFEKCWDGSGWYTGALGFSNKVTRATLGVTSWPNGSNTSIRVYYAAPDNAMKEKCWDTNSWYDGAFTQACLPASNVAVIPSPVLRVYLQNGTKVTAVTEFAWNGGSWVPGNPALPPA